MSAFEVESKHIEMLDPLQFTRLLKKLLLLEADASDIPQSATRVPLQINVPDGGEDGRIEWEGGKEKTEYIPKRFTVFQCKATNMGPQKCYQEVLTKSSRTLKEQVQAVLDKNGAYIIFCKKRSRSIESNVCKIREGLKAGKFRDWQRATVNFYDGVRIAGWVNKYFVAQIYVWSCTGQNVPFGLKTWEDWAKHEDFVHEYIWNDKLKEYKEGLLKELSTAGKSVMRVTGLSGLGKTRLTLEVFRDEDTVIFALQNNVLYFDAAYKGIENLVNFIADSRNSNLSMILVVDNCEPKLHERLVREMGYGRHNIKLITIDYDPSKVNSGTRLIHITQDNCKGIVKGILQKRYSKLSESVLNRIEEFAQNFPSIAVLLAKQVENGVEDIGRLSDEGLVEKLLWGHGSENENILEVIRACSLFEHVEFSGDEYTSDVKFLSGEVGIPEKKFTEICHKYLDIGILQRRGRFIRVCPIPLAITLSAKWWDISQTNEIIRFTKKLTKVGLLERFCGQAKRLHFSSKARAVVEKLCGPQGPFGKPEVLLSDEGSRLFLALVEVNPQATIEALWRALWGKSREELLKVKDDVRRNLVWALERLCWWEDTFEKAAKLLLRLGAAENERWGNNATEQFKQLFQIYLAGTKSNLNERLRIIREALDSNVNKERELGILALGRASETDSFSRNGGVESQGSRVPERDYEPTNQEKQEYWHEIIRLLKDTILSGGELATKAKQELGTNIGGLVRYGMIEEVEDTIKAVINHGELSWAECLNDIRHLLDYNSENMPADIHARLSNLESSLKPKGLREQLRLIVSIPDWRDRKDEDGNYVSVAAEEADQLARRLAGDDSWFKEVRVIFEGEQRQAYAFGRALGQSMPVDLRREFNELCLSILAELGREKGNADVLGAFLGNISDDGLVDETMEKIVQDKRLCIYAVCITRFLDITEKHLLRLLPLIEQNKIPVSDIRMLSYGRALNKLPEDFVTEFCQAIASSSQEGANCASDVLFMYCYQNDKRFVKCVLTFRNIIMRKDLLIGEKQSQMAGHNWEVISKKLLGLNKDVELAKHLAREIVGICGSDKVPWHHINYSTKKVLEVLLKEYFEECWSIIGEALLSKDWRARQHLGHIVGVGYEKEKSEALIAEISQEGLLIWCNKNIPHGPAAIAHITPLFLGDKCKESLHPLARWLIDNFGSLEEVMDKLGSNICSFSSGGSRAPYYQRRIDLLEELTAHPIKEVVDWAKSNIKWFEKERDEATRESQEWEWGIH